jgi:hypothetical protein
MIGRTARDLVARLRAEAGRNPYDRALSDLVADAEGQRLADPQPAADQSLRQRPVDGGALSR